MRGVKRTVEKTRHTLIIAEAGVNHNGDTDLALQLVEIAARAGADAVKFQTFKAEGLVTPAAMKAAYQLRTTNPSGALNPAAAQNTPTKSEVVNPQWSSADSDTQLSMLKRLELTAEQHRSVLEHCRKMGIEFLSTPFEEESLHYLVNDLGVRQLKISSGDLTNGPLLLAAAQTGRPIILSTGMSTLGEVEVALGVLAYGCLHQEVPVRPPVGHAPEAFQQAFSSPAGQEILRARVVLLHCTTEYPAPFDEVNLKAMLTLKEAFGLPVGLSDHTEGIAIPIGAVALGAAVIEKHFTLDRSLPGPDHKASLEPEELQAMVSGIRALEKALGSAWKSPTGSELKNRRVARKSLVALRRIEAGEVFTPENLGPKRPGEGMSPMEYWAVLGKIASRSFQENEQVSL